MSCDVQSPHHAVSSRCARSWSAKNSQNPRTSAEPGPVEPRSTRCPQCVRLECALTEVQLATPNDSGWITSAAHQSSDTSNRLFGVAKHHGVGQTQDAARIALRLPASAVRRLGGSLNRSLPSVWQATRAHRSVHLLTQQRREVLGHPERLERLGRLKARLT